MYHISDAEWEIMRVIWTQGQTRSSDIIDLLGQRLSWSDSTIKTLLGRLVEKKIISSQRQGRAFLYRAEVSEEEARKAEVDELFGRICVTEHSQLIAYLIEKTPMTLSDIEGLEALLLSKKEEVVERVVCDCLPGQCRCAHHVEVEHG